METERLVSRSIPVPDKPVASARPPVAEQPPAQAPSPLTPALPPPKVATAPLAEPALPRPERIPEETTQTRPSAPERSGLSLGGSLQTEPSAPGSKGSPSAGSGPARPSLREQIASLGSGLTDDAGGPAKRTIDLDSRDRLFVDYLARLKWRIQREWNYPEEAVRNGITGELLMVFTLNKAGSLTFIRLVRSSGFPILDEEALRAVKISAPFDPFPSQMEDEALNIQASFYYNLPRHIRRN